MERRAMGMRAAMTAGAILVFVLFAAFAQRTLAINDAMTALNENREVAFVQSPGQAVCDNCGISLFVRSPGGVTTEILSNGDPIGRCAGGPNSGASCTVDSQCPGTNCIKDGEVSGFAKRICMNDNGLVTTRIGVDKTFELSCRGGTNDEQDCTTNNDCPGGGICEERDTDFEGAVIAAGVGIPTTVVARSCDTAPNNLIITCPDPGVDVNNAGQISFSAEVSTDSSVCNTPPGENTFCNDGVPVSGGTRAIYRFTPGVGLEEMLRNGDMIGGNTVVKVATKTFGGVDASSQINAVGHIINMSQLNVGDALILMKAPGDRVQIAREGAGGDFDEIDKLGVMNSATPTQVLFKAIRGGVERLVLFTDGSGFQELFIEGDNTPQSEGEFEGFGHFWCLNNLGQAAFVAGLQNTGVAVGGAEGTGNADNDPQPQGLYFWDGNTLTEIARTTSANPGTSISEFNGFEFEWFMVAVVLNDAGTVCFAAEHSTSDPVTDNEPTAVFCWDQATGLREIYRDGNIVAGSSNTALVPAMQTMKRVLNESGDMAFVVDPTGSEDESDDNFVLFTTFDRMARAAAPLLSAGLLAVVAGFLVLTGIRRLRRRAP